MYLTAVGYIAHAASIAEVGKKGQRLSLYKIYLCIKYGYVYIITNKYSWDKLLVTSIHPKNLEQFYYRTQYQ